MFRVGQADETLPRRGLTHLVEHLALAPVSGEPGVTGRVDLLTTTLLFEGDLAFVQARLRAAATALAQPPGDRLDVERRVLAVEGTAGGAEGHLLRLWYGARGPGLAAFDELGLRHVTADDVREHASRWFVRGNAALVVVGDGAAELADGLELPPGPRRPVTPARARDVATPAEVSEPAGPLALAAPMADGPETVVLAALLERRAWAALRHERGLAYDVRCRATPVAADQRLLMLTTDVEPRDASPAAEALVEQVRSLAAGDTGADEVSGVARGLVQAMREAQPLAVLSLAAGGELVRDRVKPVEETLAEVEEVSTDRVVEAAAALAERMLLSCPDGATSSLLAGIDLLRGAPVAGRRFRRRIASRHMDARDVVVGDEGVSAMLDESAVTVRFDGCVAAVREMDGGLSLVDDAGRIVTVDPGDLRDGKDAVAAVEAHVDPAVVVGLDERSARVEASAERGLRPAFVGDAAELLAPLLGSDECLTLTAETTQGIRAGVLAVTDRRVLFVGRLLSEYVEEIPLRAIERVRRRPNPLWPSLVVEQRKGKSTFVFLTVPRLNEVAAAIASARRELPSRGG